jgi:GTP-binding protein HflX
MNPRRGDARRADPRRLPDIRGRAATTHDPAARIEEAKGLAHAIGLDIVEAFAVPIREVRPATLFGEGQIEYLGSCNLNEADLVIVDGSLDGSSAAQP